MPNNSNDSNESVIEPEELDLDYNEDEDNETEDTEDSYLDSMGDDTLEDDDTEIIDETPSGSTPDTSEEEDVDFKEDEDRYNDSGDVINTLGELVDYEYTYSVSKESAVDKYKKKIKPYTNNTQLLENLQKMINIDIDYIRKFMVASSRIAYQRDWTLDVVDKYVYKETFNNDSHLYNFHEDKVMLVYADYTVFSQHYDFKLYVYHNGKLLSDKYYFDVPSDKHYNFKSGMRRLFIEKEIFSDGDKISIVVKKMKKLTSYQQYIHIDNVSIVDYKFDKRSIGDFNGLVENLVVFKKYNTAESTFMLVDPDFYSIVEDGNYLWFTINEDVTLDSSYVIINTLKELEIKYTTTEEVDNELSDAENDGKLTRDDYLKHEATLRYDLVTNVQIDKGTKAIGTADNIIEYLPLPVSCAEEVECYVNGLRLIPNIDFKVVSDDGSPYQIEFYGIIKQGSEILIRNRNFMANKYYGFYKHLNAIDEEGFVSLAELMLPISEQYIETFIGRRRVPAAEKRYVADTIIKFDNQTAFNNCEIFPEIEFMPMTIQVLSYFNQAKPTLPRLADIYRDELTTNWLEYNDLNPNTDTNDEVYTQEEIFMGRICKIELWANPTVAIEGREPEFTVIGKYNDDDYGIDITSSCEISMFNKFQLGTQVVTAYYKEGGVEYSDSVEIEVIYKGLVNINIVTATNLYIIGDTIKDGVSVVATFEDGSTQVVTDRCTIDCPLTAREVGAETIKVSFEYNNQTITATKSVLVSDASDRKIDSIEVVLDNYVKDDTSNYSTMKFFAKFNNNFVQELDPECMDVYLVSNDSTKADTLIEDISNVSLPLNEDVRLRVDLYTSSEKAELIPYVKDGVQYITIRVLRNDIDSQSRLIIFDNSVYSISQDYTIPEGAKYYRIKDASTGIYVSVGENEVGEDAIGFANLENDQLLIVEFLNEEHENIEQLLFKARSAVYYKETVHANMVGSVTQGFTVQVNKISLGKELVDIDLDNVTLLNADNEVICKFNNLKGDTVRESDNVICFHFYDFNTTDGSVTVIADYLYNHPDDEVFVLDILNCDKQVSVKLPNTNITKVGWNKMSFEVDNEGNYYLNITPDTSYIDYSNKIKFLTTYEARPNINNLLHVEGYNVAKILADTTFELLVPKTRYGVNKYIFVYTDKSENEYYITMDVTIGLDANNKVRVTHVNGQFINSDDYFNASINQ
jgi:hypothetical protein